jgi:hypothetical protein
MAGKTVDQMVAACEALDYGHQLVHPSAHGPIRDTIAT